MESKYYEIYLLHNDKSIYFTRFGALINNLDLVNSKKLARTGAIPTAALLGGRACRERSVI